MAYDASCSVFAKSDNTIRERYRSMLNSSELQVSAVEFLRAQLLSFSATNAIPPIILSPRRGGVDNLIVPVLVCLTGSLVRQRLHGKEEWISLAVGSSLVVLIQNFKKTIKSLKDA